MGKEKRSHEEYVELVKQAVGDEYTVLGRYINNIEPILMRHNICGYEYYKKPKEFLRGQRCPKCRGRNRTTNDFIELVKQAVGDAYTVLGRYISANTKIKIRHNVCNNIYKVRPHNFLRDNGDRCPYCFGTHKKTTEEFKNEIYELVGNEYELISDYNICSEKVSLIHKKCNNIYKVKPYRFLQGDRCPYCRNTVISQRELQMIDYFNKHHILWKKEQFFKDLYYKSESNPLRYDFRIYTKDPNFFLLIEHDGKHHSEKTFYSKNFEEQQIRDKMKDDYVMNHDNMVLYRISYNEDLEKALNDFVKDNKNILKGEIL